MGNLDTMKNNSKKRTITLEKGQEKELSRLFKMGIYKELNKRGILTDLELRKIIIQ